MLTFHYLENNERKKLYLHQLSDFRELRLDTKNRMELSEIHYQIGQNRFVVPICSSDAEDTYLKLCRTLELYTMLRAAGKTPELAEYLLSAPSSLERLQHLDYTAMVDIDNRELVRIIRESSRRSRDRRA